MICRQPFAIGVRDAATIIKDHCTVQLDRACLQSLNEVDERPARNCDGHWACRVIGHVASGQPTVSRSSERMDGAALVLSQSSPFLFGVIVCIFVTTSLVACLHAANR
jgi:hypothetical protein